jgi:hypothetical protein
MLGDLPLAQVQQIVTLDRRALTELKLPGLTGSQIQNLGRRPMQVTLWGVALGDDALSFVQTLDDKFRAAAPLPFTADIVSDARLDLVLIEDLRLTELAGKPLRISYVMTLGEFLKPIVPLAVGAAVPDIAADALQRVQAIAGIASAVQDVAAGLTPFVTRFAGLLTQAQAAAKP